MRSFPLRLRRSTASVFSTRSRLSGVLVVITLGATAISLTAQAGQSVNGQIRISTKNATNRTWFREATLVRGNPASTSPGSHLQVVAATGVTLREFIGFAYMNRQGALTRTQVVGGPDWMDTQRFDVIVPVPGNSTGTALTRDDDRIAVGGSIIPVLQQLLAEQFQLRVHRENRSLPAFDLTRTEAAAAPDLKTSTATCDDRDPAQRCEFRAGPGFISVHGMTMRHLAMQLSWNFPALTKPVRDKTGMTGRFDYTLSFVPALLTAPDPTAPNVPNPAAGSGTSLRQALEQRLGLRLVETTGMFDTVVIDDVQMMK